MDSLIVHVLSIRAMRSAHAGDFFPEQEIEGDNSHGVVTVKRQTRWRGPGARHTFGLTRKLTMMYQLKYVHNLQFMDGRKTRN